MRGRVGDVVAGMLIGLMFFAFFMLSVDAVEAEAPQGFVTHAVYIEVNHD